MRESHILRYILYTLGTKNEDAYYGWWDDGYVDCKPLADETTSKLDLREFNI